MSFHVGEHASLAIVLQFDGRPSTPSEHVAVDLLVTDAGVEVAVDAPFHADPAPAGDVGPTDRLWEYEVVELMIAGDDERYLEVELSPHGHHLVLQLHGVRRVVERGLPLDFTSTIVGARWRGRATIPAARLPPGAARLNAFAIHGVGDARRFLAWRPTGAPGEAPDFHRLDRFGRWPAHET